MGGETMGAKIGIDITSDVPRPIPSAHVGSRMRRVLSRLPLGPVTAHVAFRDVNGPKGGNDIRCAVLVELPRRPAIRVERLGRTPQIAFDATYDRVVRQLERSRERQQDSRRHPKKYYAASRLLQGG
jgi:ribosome-associated translation inhibitor RaiA